MFARRLVCLLNRAGLSGLGRWASALVLVVAVTGAHVAVAQGAAMDSGLKPVGSVVLAIAADDEDMDNEEEPEEFEEDGLRPSGQAEQREQKKGEKAETRHEDAPAPE
jgi:hypothetical protein